jgi:leader peptidase (prepilin peptidase)/N-methyltransferase
VSLAAAALVVPPALALGSFLNVVIVRVPARRSLVRPPSSCMSCGARILWRDNVPVLSYVLLRGRCRHCRVRISPMYPAVEAGTAALVAGLAAVLLP